MIFTELQPKYSVLDLGFDKLLTKTLLGLQGDLNVPPELKNVFTEGVAPKTIISGELISSLEQQTGAIFSGKTLFDNSQTGYRLGVDAGTSKLYIGTNADYFNFDGTNVVISGSIAAGAIDIGGADATSFHVDSDGNMWLGAATYDIATNPLAVSNAGVIRAVSGTIGGWSIGATTFTAGSGSSTVGLDSGGVNPAIYAGGATPGTAPFRVAVTGGLTITSSAGAVSIDAPNSSWLKFTAETGDTTILNIDRNIASATKPVVSIGSTNETSGQNILNLVKGAGTGQALNITSSGTRDALEINASSTDSLSIALEVNHSGDGKGLRINLSKAANASPALDIVNSGSGEGLKINNDYASNADPVIALTQGGTGNLIEDTNLGFYVEKSGITKINYGTVAPSLNANGEMAIAVVGGVNRIYFYAGGAVHYIDATA